MNSNSQIPSIVVQSPRTSAGGHVYAEDFGAVADYREEDDVGTDNSAAFAAAVEYLNSVGGGVLRLGAGSYLGRIRIPYSSIQVVGAGPWATKIFNVGNSAAFEIDCTSNDVSYSGLSGVLIQNRNKSLYTVADGIFLNAPDRGGGIGSQFGSSFLKFDQVYIFRMRNNIRMTGRSIWNTWTNVWVAESIQNGLQVEAFDNIAQQRWDSCRFAVSGQHGVFLVHTFAGFPTVGWTFLGCTFERNLLNGVRLTGTVSGIQAWKFINCYCEENTKNMPAGGGGIKAHVFCDLPLVLGMSFDGGSMFGADPADPAMDYHIYVNTGGVGPYYGDVENLRFGISTIKDLYWKRGVRVGKNLYTSGSNADQSQASFVQEAYTAPSVEFTPLLTFGGGSVGMSYSNRRGRYVRHGNLVHFSIYVSLTGKGTSTGTALIAGLPVASVDADNVFQPVSLFCDQLQPGVVQVQARVLPNSGTIELAKFSAGTSSSITDADLGNYSALALSGSYLAM